MEEEPGRNRSPKGTTEEWGSKLACVGNEKLKETKLTRYGQQLNNLIRNLSGAKEEFRSVVVITFASHAKGLRFDPRWNHETKANATELTSTLSSLLINRLRLGNGQPTNRHGTGTSRIATERYEDTFASAYTM
ncbi:hypothetical protein TNCV_3594841 [Trichonephila clavipes]|nr:hypothetical protein TNCV_3594841 [Trichonephila clavipes]